MDNASARLPGRACWRVRERLEQKDEGETKALLIVFRFCLFGSAQKKRTTASWKAGKGRSRSKKNGRGKEGTCGGAPESDWARVKKKKKRGGMREGKT